MPMVRNEATFIVGQSILTGLSHPLLLIHPAGCFPPSWCFDHNWGNSGVEMQTGASPDVPHDPNGCGAILRLESEKVRGFSPCFGLKDRGEELPSRKPRNRLMYTR